ncbi:MAG: polyphenol oxidase family protein [bacterium]|nr:polyphenol oxidase family protein [bacterium]MDT8366450.1 polyphenol oxidase family protein [bacterium]
MTILRSALLDREGFDHGFGTRRSIPGDFPVDVHILLQVHGEKIVVLTGDPEEEKRRKGEKETNRRTVCSGASSPSPLFPFSGAEVVYQNLPAHHFRFDEGDAMVSDIPGVSLGIRTADCLPLLIVDRVRGTAAAVHCGWRSLALGLTGKAVRVMTGVMGSSEKHLLAAIGPSIGLCCYEVGEDVRDAFSHFRSGDGLFVQRDKSLYLDLASGVKTQLIMEGVAPENVDEIVGCTSCNPELFWSHRARKDKERMVSFVTVRKGYE